MQSAIAIREYVVEPEIEDHGGRRRERLRGDEGHVHRFEQHSEHTHVHEHTGCTDHCEGDEAHGYVAADGFVEKQHPEFPYHERVELALARRARAEAIRHLSDLECLWCRSNDVEQDLEAERGKSMNGCVECGASNHEESAHGIGDRLFANESAKSGSKSTHASACTIPV